METYKFAFQPFTFIRRSNAGYLGSTDMAPIVAGQWNSWLERRVRENVGWDKIAEGILLASSRPADQTYDEFATSQSGFTRSAEPADFTQLDQEMPHYWFRDNQLIPSDKALTFGYTFLGVRLDCAQCHKHPYDRWSKKDPTPRVPISVPLKRGFGA